MDTETKAMLSIGALLAAAFTALFYALGVEHEIFMKECMADGLKHYQCKALSEGHTQYINTVRMK